MVAKNGRKDTCTSAMITAWVLGVIIREHISFLISAMNLHSSCTLSILYEFLYMFNAIKYLYKMNSHDIRNSFIVAIIYIYVYVYM